jgi:hypothetical protein
MVERALPSDELSQRIQRSGLIRPGEKDSLFSDRPKPRERKRAENDAGGTWLQGIQRGVRTIGRKFGVAAPDTTGWAQETADMKAKVQGAKYLKLRLPK